MTNSTLNAPSEPAIIGEATINPATGKPASTLQGILLLIGSCLPVLGAVLLAPLLPVISGVYAGEPGVAALVPLIVTIPALVIALIAPFAGAIVDRVGRKRLLIIALVAYGILGTAPLYIPSLGGIVLSRVGVGVAEAAIMTCCTTLIADYFTGDRRNRWLGLQTVVTTLSATAFFVIGGALGSTGWRTPFWLYAVSFILIIPIARVIWQPAVRSAEERKAEKLAPVPWGVLAFPLAVVLFGGVVFYALIVELPYVLDGFGVTETSVIGLVTAVASLATAIGAILFRFIARLQAGRLLPLAFGLAGIGLLVIWSAPSVPVAVAGAVVTSFGTGILLPTLLMWIISKLNFEQRGRGAGLFVGFLFFGQFASPLILLGVGAGVGGLPTALGILGIAALLVAIIVLVTIGRPAKLGAAQNR